MTHMGIEEGHQTVSEYQQAFREQCPSEIYLIDQGINGICWPDHIPVEGPEFAAPPEFMRYVRADAIEGLAQLLIESNAHRKPDFVIGGEDNPYMRRWHLQRQADTSSIYLHQVLRDDDDRALHDHPYHSVSVVLRGVMREILPGGKSRELRAGSVVTRSAEDAHRLEVIEGPVWSLFVTGPRIREWGFHCSNGWRHWKDFVNPDDPGQPGPGCD